jgi:hypothetical protein
MICCAIGLFLIAQWLAWFRALRQTLARWRWAIGAGLLVVTAQTFAFAWHWWPADSVTEVGHHDVSLLLASSPLCGKESGQQTRR